MVLRFRFFALLLLIATPIALFSQNKLYTMAEATNGMRSTLAPERIRMFEWVPEEKAFTRLEVEDNNKQSWVKYTLPSLKADTLITTDQLNRQLFSEKPVPFLPMFRWLSAKEAWFSIGAIYYKGILSADGMHFSEWCRLPENAANVFINKESRHIAYTLDNNLYLRTADGVVHAVTTDTARGIVNGQSVHRDEFGIDRGIFFSPKGNLLAFYRMDEQMVADYPITDWSVVPAVSPSIKYPMAGGISHEVTLGVYNPVTRQKVFMKTGLPADHYLTAVTWSPDQQFIYIAILNREQNHLWLNQYNAGTGDLVKTLFEETDPKYVHPVNPLTFVPGPADQFIWQSERDGFNHLYLYNTSGKLVKQLTKGNWLVNELKEFNAGTSEFIYTSSAVSPLEKHIYAVNLHTGISRRLSPDAGWHEAVVSPDGSYVLDAFSSSRVPYTARLVAAKGKWQHTLWTASDPLKDFKRPVIKDIQLKAEDGSDLYGKLILPVDFDSTRRYPVIVYLYNGPGIQLIRNTFPASGNLWYEYMAQHGFIVFTMDGRGSANRGLHFEQTLFRQLGTVEMKDQLRGVAFLKSLPYVDAERMGVHGWSYGGFMTTSLMLKHPGVFKAAVAGGPVIDWKMYEVMYTERYMDTPQENPEGYAEANLLTKTKGLQGKLLLIHGTNDNVVVWQHSIDFIKACVDNGVQVDYFVYPGHLHNVLGKDRVHLMQKITDYFMEKLGKASP